MEIEAAEVIWKRSTDISLRYTTMLSDGDSKTWHHIQELVPYGAIEKEECVNHVSKRLRKALREVAKKEKLGGKKQELSLVVSSSVSIAIIGRLL